MVGAYYTTVVIHMNSVNQTNLLGRGLMQQRVMAEGEHVSLHDPSERAPSANKKPRAVKPAPLSAVSSTLVLSVERPPDPEPDKRVIDCRCGGQLKYTCYSSIITWEGQTIEIPQMYGWVCSACDLELLHSSVGDQLHEKMSQHNKTPVHGSGCRR